MPENNPIPLTKNEAKIGQLVRAVRIDGKTMTGPLMWWGPKVIGIGVGNGRGKDFATADTTVYAVEEPAAEPEVVPEPEPEPVVVLAQRRRKAASA